MAKFVPVFGYFSNIDNSPQNGCDSAQPPESEFISRVYESKLVYTYSTSLHYHSVIRRQAAMLRW